MADETADTANVEQLVICIRWVDNNLYAHEDFIGLYQLESTTAASIFLLLKDALLRLNLSISRLRGQCYDGAAAMAGSKAGVAAQILKEESRAVYTHCYGHALNLACSDAVKNCKIISDALDTTYEITKLIKKSPHRESILKRLKGEIASDSPGVRLLCPTRWTVKADALKSVLDNYSVLQGLLEEAAYVKDTDMKARIWGVSAQMNTFNFLFGLILGEMLLRHSDNLSRTLQDTTMSAVDGQAVAAMTLASLAKLRNEDCFALLWEKVDTLRKKLGVSGEAALPRKRKIPKRFDDGNAPHEFSNCTQDFYRRQYLESIDLLINAIQQRFDQDGYKIHSRLENMLLHAVNGLDFEDDLHFVSQFYGSDFHVDTLRCHLQLLAHCFPKGEGSISLFSSVVQTLQSCSAAQLLLMQEAVQLVKLILVMPATNAVSERSLSALRRLKTYLRSSTTQMRLNNLLVLHIHRNLTESLDLVDIANDFVKGSEHRFNQFGVFLHSDK